MSKNYSGTDSQQFLPPVGNSRYNLSSLQTDAMPMNSMEFPNSLNTGAYNYRNAYSYDRPLDDDIENPVSMDDIAYLKDQQTIINSNNNNNSNFMNGASAEINKFQDSYGNHYLDNEGFSTNDINYTELCPSNDGRSRSIGSVNRKNSARLLYSDDNSISTLLSTKSGKIGESHQIGSGTSKSNRMDMHTIRINLDRTHQATKLLADKQKIRERLESEKQNEYERKLREDKQRREKMQKQLKNSPFAKDILSEYERVSEEIKMNEKLEQQQKKREKLTNRKIRKEIVKAANEVALYEKEEREMRIKKGEENKSIVRKINSSDLSTSYLYGYTTKDIVNYKYGGNLNNLAKNPYSTSPDKRAPTGAPSKQSNKALRVLGNTAVKTNGNISNPVSTIYSPKSNVSINNIYDNEVKDVSNHEKINFVQSNELIDPREHNDFYYITKESDYKPSTIQNDMEMYDDVLVEDPELYNEIKKNREQELLILANQKARLNKLIKEKEIKY